MLEKDLLKTTRWALLAAVLIWLIGWLMLIPEDLSAQVAAVAAETVKNGRLTEETDISPPIIAMSVAAMRTFGINQLSLHVPGFMALLFTLFCTYRLALLYAGRESAILAVLILATAQATFLVNNELGDASYLAACYVLLLWQVDAYRKHRRLIHILLAAAGVTGLIVIKNKFPDMSGHFPTDPLLTLLTTFTPWTIFLILALVEAVQRLVSRERVPLEKTELTLLIAVVVPFVFIYLNPFRATFDIYMAYPVAAVVTSGYVIRRLKSDPASFSGVLAYVHSVAAYGALAMLFCLVWFVFPADNYYGLIHFMALLSVLTWLIFFSRTRNKLIAGCVVFAIGANLVLTTYFYPNIYEYQAAAKIGILARNTGVPRHKLFSYQAGTPYSLRFYSGAEVTEVKDFGQLVVMKDCYVYTHQNLVGEFRAMRPDLKIVGSSEEYTRRVLDFRFLDPASRASHTTSKVLIKL